MGGRQVGRSEPAFLSASTIVLPPPTCTARREAGQRRLRLLFCCEAGQLLAVVCYKACAGQTTCRLCLPAAAVSCELCVPARLCHAMPTAHIHLPRSVLLCPHPLFSPCAPGSSKKLQQFASCKNCPVGSNNAGLQWRPARHVASTPHFLCCKDCPVGSRARGLHLGSPCAVVRYVIKGGGLGLHVGSRPSSPHLHFASQRLHASSLAPC